MLVDDVRVGTQLTRGDWPVDALAAVDEARGLAYFVAGRASPTQSALYAVPLAGGGFARSLGENELDLVVPRDAADDWRDRLVAASVRPAGVWAYEARRVAALRPRLGVDTDEKTLPHEIGWIGGPGEGAVHLDTTTQRTPRLRPSISAWPIKREPVMPNG